MRKRRARRRAGPIDGSWWYFKRNAAAFFAGACRTASANPSAVRVAAVVPDARPPVLRFEPGHPDANAEGYVAYPQVDPIEEMTDLLGAVRAYELNASAVQATKNMISQSLDLCVRGGLGRKGWLTWADWVGTI